MPSTLMGGLIINEILVDPSGTTGNTDTDGNGTADNTDQYVELYNNGTTTLNIGGVQLWDQGVGNWFTFPPNTFVIPGAHVLVMSGVQSGGALPSGAPGDLFFDAGRASALINNGGDNVVVYDPGTDQYIVARYNGDAPDNPVASYAGFSATATQSGTNEDFGNDIDGVSIQRGRDGSDTLANNQTATPGITNICLTHGTYIATPDGPVLIQSLKVGDMVSTLDNGPQPILWTFAQSRHASDVAENPRHGAIHIARGALGENLPHRGLVVSRHHRMLIRSRIAKRMFGTEEVLVAAKELTDTPGISPAPAENGFVFYHLLLPKHAVLFAEGAATESLFLGPGTRAALSSTARASLAQVEGLVDHVTPARTIAKGAKARKLCARHIANQRDLCPSCVRDTHVNDNAT